VIDRSYYDLYKSTNLSKLKFITLDNNNVFAYEIISQSGTKDQFVPYIIKTFKILDKQPSDANKINSMNTSPSIKINTTTPQKNQSNA
jgi:hypothetical protein